MQRLSKTSLVTLIIGLVVLAGLAVAAGLGLFSDAPRKDTASGPMLRYIPADTPFAVIGRGAPEAAQQVELWLDRVDLRDLEPLLELLDDNTEVSIVPLASWLLRDYVATVTEGGYDALVERYGSDAEGAYAFYLHGAMPVFRVALQNQDALLARLDQAAEETGVSHREELIGGATARIWPLLVNDNGQNLELGVVVADDMLTISLLSGRDEGAARAERFARQPMASNLEGSEILADGKRHFARSDLMLGYLDLHRLVEALLLPEQNSSGRELQRLFPDFMDEVAQKLSPACRRDYVGVVANMPRNLFGITEYRADDNEVETGFRNILAINHPEVSAQLQRLPGFLPAYSQSVDDKLFAFALGVNVDELVPALTELWTRFIGATYECDKIQEMQRLVNSYNPMMLSLGTAMARGVKGMGFALYDIEADAQNPGGVGGSALLSLSAENPAALATLLTSYVPGMAGTLLPADGTSVAINAPQVPAGIYAAIKGKHLVVYKGEAATAAANALAGETLEVNGTSALVLNSRRATERLLTSPETLTAIGTAGNCNATYMMLLAMSDSPFELAYRETFNDLGWDGRFDMAVTLPMDIRGNLPGTYTLSYLDEDDCTWTENGIETINADGSGGFASFDQELGCSTFETEYQWTRTGGRLTQSTTAQRERDYCEEGWAEQEPDDFTCRILAFNTAGFHCVWEEDGEMEIYRFSRQ